MGSGALSAGPPPPPTPHKKMKKRKELNALIGLAGDGGRKKGKKGSGHRLLRTEPPASDSDTDSEEDEFGSVGERHNGLGRANFLQCCKICYPLCGFVVLTACIVTCFGLVWMQVVLKENMDTLKEKFREMESNQKSSLEEIPKINEDLLLKQKHLDDIITGDTGLNKLWDNITEINKQIAVLTTAVNNLKATIKSASQLINLPNTMEELQKSVATLGNTLTSVHNDVETMQTVTEEQKKKVETLQKDVDVLFLQNNVDDINATFLQYQKQNDLKLHNVDSALSDLNQRFALVENNLYFVNKTENGSVSQVNSTTSPETSSYPTTSATDLDTSQDTNHGQSSASVLQQKLQLIQALTKQPESDKQPLKDKSGSKASTSASTLSRLVPRSLSAEKGEITTALPGIFSVKDLEEIFIKSVNDVNGKLSYQELKNLIGLGLPTSEYLQKFDVDGDNKFSIAELKVLLHADH
ncbi:hypothetical protein GDO86_007873 [Hymenochirus boettgeri]|uniref:EF-hand domain-containing protein n=1 Tax=Hymenochirus boettgeri TaxID=247094 RepID=A0A8T2J3J0_9PIPI|nr:hypothetical protein GDO86_007873 [Hymenochirus boettgeri]